MSIFIAIQRYEAFCSLDKQEPRRLGNDNHNNTLIGIIDNSAFRFILK